MRTKTVKKASRVMIKRYYSRMTMDFHTNKKIAEEVAIIPSKRLRNKITGFATYLMKHIQCGPVRVISLKLQEEERERHMDFVMESERRLSSFAFVCLQGERTIVAVATAGFKRGVELPVIVASIRGFASRFFFLIQQFVEFHQAVYSKP